MRRDSYALAAAGGMPVPQGLSPAMPPQASRPPSQDERATGAQPTPAVVIQDAGNTKTRGDASVGSVPAAMTQPAADMKLQATSSDAVSLGGSQTTAGPTTPRNSGNNTSTAPPDAAMTAVLASSGASINVTIPHTATAEAVGVTYTVYVIRVAAGQRIWNVARSCRDFRELHAALHAATAPLSSEDRASLAPLPASKRAGGAMSNGAIVEERRRTLETYLQAVILIPAALQVRELVVFLDEPQHSPLATHLAVLTLQARMVMLEAACDDARSQTSSFESVITSQRAVINMLVRQLTSAQAAMAERGFPGVVSVPAAADLHAVLQASPKLGITAPTSGASGIPGVAAALSSPSSLQSLPTLSTTAVTTALWDIIPRNTRPNALDLRVDALIMCLLPTPEADAVRTRAESFVVSLIKRALGAQVFPVGPHPTRTFLEDDPVGLSVFMCLGQERVWFSKVADVLFAASTGALSDQADSIAEVRAPSDDEADPAYDGMITIESAISARRRRLRRRTKQTAAQNAPGATSASGLQQLTTLLRRTDALHRTLAGDSGIDNNSAVAAVTESLAFSYQGVPEVSGLHAPAHLGTSPCGQGTMASGYGMPSHLDPACRVRAVAFLTNQVKRITAEVDDICVSISANQLHELCQVGVVEDADAAIGMDHLFKRSLLLFRAWVLHDSARSPRGFSPSSAAGAASMPARAAGEEDDLPPPLACLSWRVCTTILLWVFVRRRHILHTPLQVLAWLLADLAAFDWNTYALSIAGAVPLTELEAHARAANVAVDISPRHITAPPARTTYDPASGYLPAAPRHQSQAPAMPTTAGYAPHDRVPDHEVFSVLSEGALQAYRRKCARRRGAGTQGAGRGEDAPYAMYADVPPEPAVQSGLASALSPVPLRVRSLCVLDVLDPLHNLAESISASDGTRIRAALDESARQLHTVFLHAQAAAAPGNQCQHTHIGSPPAAESLTPCGCQGPTLAALTTARLDAMFARCWERYAPNGASGNVPSKLGALLHAQSLARDAAMRRGLAADAIAYDVAASGVFNVLQGCIEEVRTNIDYCSFLLDSEVTAPALLSLASEILSDRGPLPVGEIGKLLQEATSNVSLSTVLKERFGGLKRFLESNADVFVLGADHPFNPHVYLKCNAVHAQLLRQSGQGGMQAILSGGGADDDWPRSSALGGKPKITKAAALAATTVAAKQKRMGYGQTIAGMMAPGSEPGMPASSTAARGPPLRGGAVPWTPASAAPPRHPLDVTPGTKLGMSGAPAPPAGGYASWAPSTAPAPGHTSTWMPGASFAQTPAEYGAQTATTRGWPPAGQHAAVRSHTPAYGEGSALGLPIPSVRVQAPYGEPAPGPETGYYGASSGGSDALGFGTGSRVAAQHADQATLAWAAAERAVGGLLPTPAAGAVRHGHRLRASPAAAVVAAAAAGDYRPMDARFGIPSSSMTSLGMSQSQLTSMGLDHLGHAAYAAASVEMNGSVPVYSLSAGDAGQHGPSTSVSGDSSIFSTFTSGSILGMGMLAEAPAAAVMTKPVDSVWRAAPAAPFTVPGMFSPVDSPNDTEMSARFSSLLSL